MFDRKLQSDPMDIVGDYGLEDDYFDTNMGLLGFEGRLEDLRRRSERLFMEIEDRIYGYGNGFGEM